jgi:hypothetical protein
VQTAPREAPSSFPRGTIGPAFRVQRRSGHRRARHARHRPTHEHGADIAHGAVRFRSIEHGPGAVPDGSAVETAFFTLDQTFVLARAA